LFYFFFTVKKNKKKKNKVRKKKKKKEIESEIVKYKYTDSDATNKTTLYKIYSRTEEDGARLPNEICNAKVQKPFEFILVQWPVESDTNPNVDYYIEGNNSDLKT